MSASLQSANGFSYWRPDNSTPECELCLMPFTMFNRRHHCRDCGGVFCAKCTEKKTSMTYRGHEKPQRICTLCHKYAANKLLKKNVVRAIQKQREHEQEEAPIFGGPATAGGGGGIGAGGRMYSTIADDEEALSQYDRIAKRFKDAMIKRAETERELTNYSFIGGGPAAAGSTPQPSLQAATAGTFNATSNASFSRSQSRQHAAGALGVVALMDCPKKHRYLEKMTKATSSSTAATNANNNKKGEQQQKTATAPPVKGPAPILAPGSTAIQGDVMAILNFKAAAGTGIPPPTPGGGVANGTFAQSPKADKSFAINLAANFGTANNVHPAFLKVREQLHQAHKVTLDSGAAQLMGHENHQRAGSVMTASGAGGGVTYNPKPSEISIFAQ